jgi:hypothetical protein
MMIFIFGVIGFEMIIGESFEDKLIFLGVGNEGFGLLLR